MCQTKTISLNQRKIWADEIIDFTCIEIKENEDSIDTFFYLDEKKKKKNSFKECYLNQNVIIYGINFKNGNKFAFSNGIIKSIKVNYFIYTCNTFPGCSGGCITNQYNNCIIGVHKGKIEDENKNAVNAGIFIGDIVKYIKENKNILSSNVN